MNVGPGSDPIIDQMHVDAAYIPSMDDYLKPLIPGIMAPDKPLKDLQDNILDTFGPLCTMFENLLVMLDNLGSNGVVQLDESSMNCFLSCVKHALLLAGDASASINVNRRELVLKKINPLLASMKTRSETADTIEKADEMRYQNLIASMTTMRVYSLTTKLLP